MPTFVWIGHDGPRGVELRKQHRPAHVAGLESLAAQGRVRFAGPLLGPAGAPVGSVIVLDAPDLASAQAIAAGDAYATQGVFERWEVFATTVVFPRPAGEPGRASGPGSSVTRGSGRE
jgi:uncharacterized protein YciI